jgi:AmmeMemoRadiSam system protein B/AmmeMemoRadiSam system protein A
VLQAVRPHVDSIEEWAASAARPAAIYRHEPYIEIMRLSQKAAPAVRRPAVAGLFYPEAAETLRAEIERLLGGVKSLAPRPSSPKALIVPHAGYVYSGPIAASAYALLHPARGTIRRVVLLGPCHRVPVRGLALPAAEAFDTPLGRVRVDADAAAALRELPQVEVSGQAHALEHSLEVQLPFLQTLLGDFDLVPLAVGAASPRAVAEVLDHVWGGPETLIVVSSDLSHYLPYAAACDTDRATVNAILALRDDLDHEQACGATPVGALALAARARGLEPELLDLRNSGDTAGDRDRVVGYASIAFWPPGEQSYDETHGRELLGVARDALTSALGNGAESENAAQAAWLRAPRASFVTLTAAGALRGCIGTLFPRRPLGEDVAANALSAALHDPRFPAVARAELEGLRIEVSVISPLVPMRCDHEDELFASLVPGEDGLVLEYGDRQATFLPQVWSQLPEPARFLGELRRKAGLSAATPLRRCRVSRYRVVKWREAT